MASQTRSNRDGRLVVRTLSAIIKELNFFRVHVICFLLVPLIVSSVIFAANSTFQISYIDCLFLAVSAITTTGLATVDLSKLNGFQQACLFVSFALGAMASVSSVMLIVRQHFFRRSFRTAIKEQEKRTDRLMRYRSDMRRRGENDQPAAFRRDSKTLASLDPIPSLTNRPTDTEDLESGTGSMLHDRATATRRSGTEMRRAPTTSSQPAPARKNTGLGGFPTPFSVIPSLAQRIQRYLTGDSASQPATGHRLDRRFTTEPVTIEGNSRFSGMNQAQKVELGDVEYRASKLLLKIVLAYIVLTPLIAFTILGPYMVYNPQLSETLDTQHQRVSIAWFTAFNVWSAFTNCGMSLSDASMIPFQNAYLLVTITTFLIFMGNTAFAVCLRGIIAALCWVVPEGSETRQSLDFLLRHPRRYIPMTLQLTSRCFPYLFPARQTCYLALVVFVLTSIDFLAFLILDIDNPVIEAIPVGTRILAALMQAAAVRVEGFAIVSLSALAPAVQVSFVVMMYIAILPLTLAVRSTNVYEEQSLGIYKSEEEEDNSVSTTGYIGWHLKRQLAFDLWWLSLAMWLICIIERFNILDEEKPWFNLFSILFEIVSAYGTVGLSLGSSGDNFSLSGNFHTLSKLVLVAVMLRGRHRGLPLAIDRAVMLPSDIDDIEDSSR